MVSPVKIRISTSSTLSRAPETPDNEEEQETKDMKPELDSPSKSTLPPLTLNKQPKHAIPENKFLKAKEIKLFYTPSSKQRLLTEEFDPGILSSTLTPKRLKKPKLKVKKEIEWTNCGQLGVDPRCLE